MPASLPLKNARHERFALGVASGQSATAAYRRAGYGAKDADTAGPRLSGNVGIAERIGWLKKQAATEAVLTLAEKRKFLRGVVLKKQKERTTDRLKALELDAKLAGEFKPEKVEMTGTWEVVIGEA